MKSLSTASHPSYPHFIPQPAPSNTWPVLCFRYLSFIAIVGAWVLLCSTETKLRAILVAFSFSCVEFTFRALTIKHPVGTSIDARGRVSNGPKEQGIRLYWSRLSWNFIKVNGFTTWEQFWGNVFYGPIMNDLYRDTLIPWLPFFTHLSGHWQMMIRAFFYPLNIWVGFLNTVGRHTAPSMNEHMSNFDGGGGCNSRLLS